MDEPLEEVLLGRVGGSPGVLERLVRGEVLAGTGELEPAGEVRFHRRHLVSTLTEWYPQAAVATILLAGVDLFIRGKLEAWLPGHHLVTTDSVDPPDLVIADIARVDPYEVAEAYPDVPIAWLHEPHGHVGAAPRARRGLRPGGRKIRARRACAGARRRVCLASID